MAIATTYSASGSNLFVGTLVEFDDGHVVMQATPVEGFNGMEVCGGLPTAYAEIMARCPDAVVTDNLTGKQVKFDTMGRRVQANG